jgi:hypothetical protein
MSTEARLGLEQDKEWNEKIEHTGLLSFVEE